ncbi:hypothetical protein N7466_009599 [Penicillium verhagenii]|uniref:uncharacterized protein n=1 Tax=Penicillium verhagenii TaxID=1562060 RepID=UPI00254519C7|nr:uncharacterized protein N7466_009599 [Penicillium verhagenii]KAJ5921273.1 hypothetical protein N7466_009599 [Penicillium verhagenii]
MSEASERDEALMYEVNFGTRCSTFALKSKVFAEGWADFGARARSNPRAAAIEDDWLCSLQILRLLFIPNWF